MVGELLVDFRPKIFNKHKQFISFLPSMRRSTKVKTRVQTRFDPRFPILTRWKEVPAFTSRILKRIFRHWEKISKFAKDEQKKLLKILMKLTCSLLKIGCRNFSLKPTWIWKKKTKLWTPVNFSLIW